MIALWKILQLARRFQGYLPRSADFFAIRAFVHQFDSRTRPVALEMLNNIRFYSANETQAEFKRMLLELQRKYLAEGLPESAVYVLPASDTGASSREMFQLCKSICKEQRINFEFFDRGALELRKKLRGLNRCILVFVDDFSGSGKQFETSIATKWSTVTGISGVTSVFMTVVICTEAVSTLTKAGVELKFSHEHGIGERFQSLSLNPKIAGGFPVLCSYARELHNREPVGYKHMGCMVVMYRNSSNNMPLLLRGTRGQRIWRGLFPRHEQLVSADHTIAMPGAEQA